jgi:hypothetical protein
VRNGTSDSWRAHRGGNVKTRTLKAEGCGTRQCLATICQELAGFFLEGFDGGKPPSNVWLMPGKARLEDTVLLGGDTASRARHGGYMLRSEFAYFHFNRIRRRVDTELCNLGQG